MKHNPSCLSELMNSNHAEAVKLCRIVIKPINELVIDLGKNQFLLYHNKKVTITEKCGDKTEKYQIHTTEKFRVKDGCTAKLRGILDMFAKLKKLRIQFHKNYQTFPYNFIQGHKLFGVGDLDYSTTIQVCSKHLCNHIILN